MQVILIMQDDKLEEIQQRLIQMTQAPRDPVEAPTNVDLVNEDQKE